MSQHSVRVGAHAGDEHSVRDVALQTEPTETRPQIVKAFIGLSTRHLEEQIVAWQQDHPEYDITQVSMGSELRALILFQRVRVRIG